MERESETPGTIVSAPAKSQIPWDDGQQFFDLWNEMRGAQKWPRKAQMNPLDMKPYITNIMLIETIYGEPAETSSPDFVIRLAGTGYREFMPFDATGHRIADLPGGERLKARFAAFLEQQTAHLLLDRPLMWSDYEAKHFDGLIVPLGNDQQITHFMLVVRYK